MVRLSGSWAPAPGKRGGDRAVFVGPVLAPGPPRAGGLQREHRYTGEVEGRETDSLHAIGGWSQREPEPRTRPLAEPTVMNTKADTSQRFPRQEAERHLHEADPTLTPCPPTRAPLSSAQTESPRPRRDSRRWHPRGTCSGLWRPDRHGGWRGQWRWQVGDPSASRKRKAVKGSPGAPRHEGRGPRRSQGWRR